MHSMYSHISLISRMSLLMMSSGLSFEFSPSAMDVGRALLKFAVGYPLGEKGLDWLKIHLVNLHGEKKK